MKNSVIRGPIARQRIVRKVACPTCKRDCYALINARFPFLDWAASPHFVHGTLDHAKTWADAVRRTPVPTDKNQDIVFESRMYLDGTRDIRDDLKDIVETQYVPCLVCQGEGYTKSKILALDGSEPDPAPCDCCGGQGLIPVDPLGDPVDVIRETVRRLKAEQDDQEDDAQDEDPDPFGDLDQGEV